jgi:hypothetical protein
MMTMDVGVLPILIPLELIIRSMSTTSCISIDLAEGCSNSHLAPQTLKSKTRRQPVLQDIGFKTRIPVKDISQLTK